MEQVDKIGQTSLSVSGSDVTMLRGVSGPLDQGGEDVLVTEAAPEQ